MYKVLLKRRRELIVPLNLRYNNTQIGCSSINNFLKQALNWQPIFQKSDNTPALHSRIETDLSLKALIKVPILLIFQLYFLIFFCQELEPNWHSILQERWQLFPQLLRFLSLDFH